MWHVRNRCPRRCARIQALGGPKAQGKTEYNTLALSRSAGDGTPTVRLLERVSGGGGEREKGAQAAEGRIFQADRAVVELGDVADDGEPEAGAGD